MNKKKAAHPTRAASSRREPTRPPGGFGLNAGWVDEPMDAAHRHQDVEVNFVQAGGAEYQIAGRTVELEAGEILVFWAVVGHQLRSLPQGGRVIYLHLPLTAVLHWSSASPLIHAVSRGEVLRVRRGRLADLDQAAFRLWAEELASADARGSLERRRQALDEIELRFRRMAHEDWDGEVAGRHGPVPDVVVDLATCIASRCADPAFRVGTAAEAVGLNERYAMSLFKKHLGLTLHEFILRHRVTHAQHLLVATDDTVLAVGLDSGFTSQSGFYATFKRYCGVSPARYRALAG